MNITAAPSRRGTNNERLFRFHCREAAPRSLRGRSYCADYRCSHSIAISADSWPEDLRLSDIEERFVCRACGKRGADVRPDFNWNRQRPAMMGYRCETAN